MINITDKSKCCGCTACASICPKQCISMTSDEEGFLFPAVNKSKCINCRLCERVCPIKQRSEPSSFEPLSFWGYNKNKEVQMKSSSGGIFSLFAEKIISRGGVVFGAAFDEKFDVKHIYIDKIDDIDKLRRSKYVQSELGNCFQQIKGFLENGRLVYFTGTPCQIEGLKKFLIKDYDNLITQDFVCHGVPSPLIWSKYKEQQTAKYGSPLTEVSFRDKQKGWINFSMKLTFTSGETYSKPHSHDEMFNAFLKNKCLRESCYSCNFRGIKRTSDITLADFWGANIIIPRKFDKNGTSIIMLNSKKGADLFDSIKQSLKFEKMKLSTATLFNPSLVKSAKRPHCRENYISAVTAPTSLGGGILHTRRILRRKQKQSNAT